MEMGKLKQANSNVTCNEPPFSVFLARTWCLHSLTAQLDIECPIEKSHTFAAFQSTTNTNRIGQVHLRIPQIDWSPVCLVHKSWKEMWPSKSTRSTKEPFPMYLSHQPTLKIEKIKEEFSFVSHADRNEQKLMYLTNWNWSAIIALDKLNIFHAKNAKREYLDIWLKSIISLKNECALTIELLVITVLNSFLTILHPKNFVRCHKNVPSILCDLHLSLPFWRWCWIQPSPVWYPQPWEWKAHMIPEKCWEIASKCCLLMAGIGIEETMPRNIPVVVSNRMDTLFQQIRIFSYFISSINENLIEIHWKNTNQDGKNK